MAIAKESGTKTAKPSNPVDDIVGTVGLMTRLLAKLGEHAIFKDQDLGLTEWTFLHAIADGDAGQGSGQVAQRLAITPQRAAQVVANLTKLGYAAATTSGDDTRKKNLSITPLGRSKLKLVDDKVLALIQKAFGDRAQVMTNMRRNVRTLLTTVAPPQPKATGQSKTSGATAAP